MKEAELDQLSSFLKKKHFPLKAEWLKTCLQYLEQSVGSETLASNKILDLVIQQFVNSDLSDSLNPFMKIPTNAVKVIIVKKMIFQITSYTDISVSLYEQLSECTRHNDDLSWFHGGSNVENDEENVEKEVFNCDGNNNSSKSSKSITKKPGMLKFELTDGINKVKAIELEKIYDEKLLAPGIKILLTGKVKCRRGTLLLDRSNCTFLGGCIEYLKIDKVEQLSRALKIDLDAEKKRREESLKKAAEAVLGNHKKQIDKKNSILNQSSISPFLVKTNRKTGEVTNQPKLPNLSPTPLHPLSSNSNKTKPNVSYDPIENWHLSFEEAHEPATTAPAKNKDSSPAEFLWNSNSIKPQALVEKIQTENIDLPPPPSIKPLPSIEFTDKLAQYTSNKLNSVEKSLQNNKAVEDWTFNSVYFDKTLKNNGFDPRPKSKQLPCQLLRNTSEDRPALGDPLMDVEKRKEILKWVWEDRKESEEELMAKRKNSDSVVEIPPCFMKEKRGGHTEENRTKLQMKKVTRNIHGPRIDIDAFRSKQQNYNSDNNRITEHFPTIKNTTSSTLKLDSFKPVNLHSFQDSYVSIDPTVRELVGRTETPDYNYEGGEVEDFVSETPSPARHQYHSSPKLNIYDGNDEEDNDERRKDDSIMEITIEQEGRLECERWGLSGRKREASVAEEQERLEKCLKKKRDCTPDNDSGIGRVFPHSSNFPVPVHVPFNQEVDYRESQQIPNAYQHSQALSHLAVPLIASSHPDPPAHSVLPQNWNIAGHLPIHTLPYDRVKTEWPDISDDRKMLIIRNPPKSKSAGDQEDKVIKNKQSANVQIYKTPFAKRLSSGVSSTSAASQLLERMSNLQIVPFADALANRKYWMMSKIVVVMPTICHQLHELKSDGIDWLLQISVTDTSVANVKCRVATDLLNRIFGFNVQQCKNLFNEHHVEELRAKKCEAERKLLGFKRLDLLVWVEVLPDSNKLPLILDVKTISDALNIL